MYLESQPGVPWITLKYIIAEALLPGRWFGFSWSLSRWRVGWTQGKNCGSGQILEVSRLFWWLLHDWYVRIVDDEWWWVMMMSKNWGTHGVIVFWNAYFEGRFEVAWQLLRCPDGTSLPNNSAASSSQKVGSYSSWDVITRNITYFDH